jgi:hypothetical protein
MGEAKRRKERLGEFYGKPIGPGHPDFVPSKKSKPIRPFVRFIPEGSEEGTDIAAETVNLFVGSTRIEVERMRPDFGDPTEPWFTGQETKGKLITGSVTRDVELHEFGETKVVFRWLREAQEATDEQKITDDAATEHGTQEEPTVQPRRTIPTGYRRPRPMLFAALAGASIGAGTYLGPEPEYKPRKKF